MKGFRQRLNRNKRPNFDVDNYAPQRTDSVANTIGSGDGAGSLAVENYDNETPEAAAQRLVRTFCMSEVDEAGAEVALLPSIVEAAESSPQAAAECARYIRKFMYRDYWSRPNFVYNAIMLMRILVENPGLTFTRNMDKKFIDTVRELLRGCGHAHIVHFLIETLQDFETKGAVDEGIGRLVEMWQKEKTKSKSAYSNQQGGGQGGRGGLWQRPQPQMWVPQGHSSSRGQYERGHGSSATLPKPRDLKKRLDEARTTASVLADVVNTNTPAALLKHDLADDLSARCRRATGQVLEYLNARDPIPDNQEMAALLATHEVLQQTLHHYHRAVLEARKGLGVGETRRTEDGSEAAEMTPAGKGKANAPTLPGAGPGASGPSGANNGNGGGGSNGYSNDLETIGTDGLAVHEEDGTFGRNDDDDMIAAAIAASTAPGANGRGGHRGYANQYEAGGPASEAENPFADNIQPESSRSSSRVRPAYGGGSSSAAAGSSAAGGVAYADSDNESDQEYLRVRRRNKNVAGSSSNVGEGSGSSSAGAAASPPVPPSSSKPGPASPRSTAQGSPTGDDESTSRAGAAAGGSSSSSSRPVAGPAVDAAAHSSSQYGSGPVFRY